MTFRQGILLLCAGASCAAAQFCMTGAYRYAAPTQISVYDSSQIVFSALLGYLFFAQIPGITSLLAYIIIISASLILFVVQKKEANVPEKEKG